MERFGAPFVVFDRSKMAQNSSKIKIFCKKSSQNLRISKKSCNFASKIEKGGIYAGSNQPEFIWNCSVLC